MQIAKTETFKAKGTTLSINNTKSNQTKPKSEFQTQKDKNENKK